MNFGARNYKDEEIESKDRIMDLQDRIRELNEEIREILAARSYEDVVRERRERQAYDDMKKPLYEMSTEDFLYYAFGTWGEQVTDIRLKLEHGAYEKEKESIDENIFRQRRRLSELGSFKRSIDEKYDDLCAEIIMLVIALCLCGILGAAFSKSVYMFGTALITGIIYFICTIFRIKKRYPDVYFLYQAEHNYKKYQAAIEDRRIIPVPEQKDKILRDMKDSEKRLEYVEQMLERKQEIINGNYKDL